MEVCEHESVIGREALAHATDSRQALLKDWLCTCMSDAGTCAR